MENELAKTYNPADFEQRVYQRWLAEDDFSPKEGNPYTIVIPPPNVTGTLHMGHGLNTVLQDILVRYERMQQNAALWLPGTDHAGIATQHIVEKRIQQEGKTRHELGREAFLQRTWQVKEEHHSIIKEQFRQLGASVDWRRERFTMDEGLSQAVREAFVRLYEEGLIYRGEYLVNWCPTCTTALADDEVEHQEENGGLYTLVYPFADEAERTKAAGTVETESSGVAGIVVATTRPETLFGDQAVAVHPEDPRYQQLIGKEVLLPLTGRKIPIIADSFCDMEFGSGAVKITPAHDPNDKLVAERHGLALLNILTVHGSLNDEVPEAFRGLPSLEARKAVLSALKEGGFLMASEQHRHQVGHCYRCNTVIEPYLSKQWFVKMQPLAKKALAAYETGEIRFYPSRWGNTYRHWMQHIRDWCISRQLWWGHRIPAWHCQNCKEITVSRQEPTACRCCHSTELSQDPDVLDTWFSSWLWPFSTLGWPEESPDYQRFYPTQTLVTAYDIIFFWVARMVMAGLHFTAKVPFSDIYITPLVRDKQGRKMSKSLGNGIDPLEVIQLYGADALKFTISYLSTQGQDLPLEMESFKLGSRFCNKIWNAFRFLLLSLERVYKTTACTELPQLIEAAQYQPLDQWIWQRFSLAVEAVEKGRAVYRFDEMSHACYEFFWNDFCDWYVEGAKISLGEGRSNAELLLAAAKLVEILEASLRLLHPFISFLSEELYAKLPLQFQGKRLINAAYPHKELEPRHCAPALVLQHFTQLQELVTGVRTLRSEFGIAANLRFSLILDGASPEFSTFFASEQAWIEGLCCVRVQEEASQPIGLALQEGQVLLYVRESIDLSKERQRLSKLTQREEQLAKRIEAKLANPQFTQRAPAQIIDQERQKLARLETSLKRNQQFLKQLS